MDITSLLEVAKINIECGLPENLKVAIECLDVAMEHIDT